MNEHSGWRPAPIPRDVQGLKSHLVCDLSTVVEVNCIFCERGGINVRCSVEKMLLEVFRGEVKVVVVEVVGKVERLLRCKEVEALLLFDIVVVVVVVAELMEVKGGRFFRFL